jgi:hypothetical protein
MLDRAHLFLALSLISTAAAGVACTKSEGESSGTSSTATTATSMMPSASASAAMAAPDASPVAADTTTGTSPTAGADATAPMASTTAMASATASAKTTASASPNAGADACGTKPLPDCPLQAWMKANTNSAIASGDLPALATALDKTATFAPAGYGNWATIAKDGAKAAKASDMTAAKASCRTCHDQYKDKYKKEMRARKI